jgi:hypothetical protein
MVNITATKVRQIFASMLRAIVRIRLGGLWRLMNAPVVIWLLTVVVVGLFGTMYDDIKRCRAEAGNADYSLRRLLIEIDNRRNDLYSAIIGAASADELRNSDVVKDWRQLYTYEEYKGRTLEDLENQLFSISRRVQYTPKWVGSLYQRRFSLIIQHRVFVDLNRADFERFKDGDLPALKEISDEEQLALMELYIDRSDIRVTPLCGVLTAFSRVLTGNPEYIGKAHRIHPSR